MARYYVIDPSEQLDYVADWNDFLADAGSPSDTISSSSWAVEPLDGSPTGPTLSSESNTTTEASVFISDVVAGSLYRLTNTITTVLGRTAERSITLRGENR